MKKLHLILFIAITVIFEIFFTTKYTKDETIYQNNTIKINELVKEIEQNYEDISKYPNFLEYTLLDENENIIYKTNNSYSKNLNEAYKNRDTIIDFTYQNNKKGKIIIYNDFKEIIKNNKQTYIKIIIIISFIQISAFIVYYLYLYINILRPFKKMKDFATRISSRKFRNTTKYG